MAIAGHGFRLQDADTEILKGVGDRLRGIGYTERGVRKRLGLSRLSDLRLESYPYYLHTRLARNEPLDVAIRLFLLQDAVVVEDLDTVLDKPQRLHLGKLGILMGRRSDHTYRAAASIYPQRELLIATDHRFTHQPWVAAREPGDPVMPMGEDAYVLMRATLRRPVRKVLDLCCGAAFHGIFSTAFSDRVVAVDSSRRAVTFARLNAMLNSAWNITVHEGDLFEPVRGERFDYVMATPPCAPSPGYELRWRDGGPSGADVLRRVIAMLPDFLSSTGYAQIVAHVGERHGEPYLERLRRWLSGANMNIHSLKFSDESIDEYAVAQLAAPFGADFQSYRNEHKRWIDNMRTQRFKRIVRTVLTFEWNDDRAMPPWTQEDEVKLPRRSIGDEILQLFEARKRTRQANAAADLDHCVAGVPDDLLLTERRSPSGAGFVTKDFRITWRDPALSPELEIKPLVRELLELVDNRRRVPEIIEAYTEARGLPPGSVDSKARQAFLAMFERGLVTLDRVAGAPAPTTGPTDDQLADMRPRPVSEHDPEPVDDLLDPDKIPDLDGMLVDADGVDPLDKLTAPPIGSEVDPLAASTPPGDPLQGFPAPVAEGPGDDEPEPAGDPVDPDGVTIATPVKVKDDPEESDALPSPAKSDTKTADAGESAASASEPEDMTSAPNKLAPAGRAESKKIQKSEKSREDATKDRDATVVQTDPEPEKRGRSDRLRAMTAEEPAVESEAAPPPLPEDLES